MLTKVKKVLILIILFLFVSCGQKHIDKQKKDIVNINNLTGQKEKSIGGKIKNKKNIKISSSKSDLNFNK